MPEDGLIGPLLNREPSSGGMTDDPNHSGRILLKSFVWIADGSNDLMFEVSHSSDVIDNRKICNIVEEAVNGDVTAQRIFLGCAKTFPPDEFALFCLYFFEFGSTPESGYLDDLSFSEKYVDQSEPAANDPTISEESVDLMGVRIRGDVKVFGDLSKEEISNTSTDEIGQKPMSVKSVEDF
jgi:hypothetical protein